MLALALALFHSDPLFDFVLHQLIWLLSQPLFWAALGVVVGPYLFYRGFRLLQRKRLILDIPRSTIRAAAIGPVEVSGKAVGPYTLVSPVSKRECLYYRVVVRAQRQAAAAYSDYRSEDAALLAFGLGFLRQTFKKNSGQIIDEVCAPLFVDDGTGELMIYPKGAETQLPCFGGDGGDYLAGVLARHGFSKADYEAAEELCILPEQEIFVMGTLRENPWATRKPSSEEDSLARIGPGFVSADEADLQRREAFCLNPAAPSGALQPREFNLYPPVILSQGDCPFIISNLSQREIVSRLSWKSLLFIWGGPIWTLWAVWEILGHPEIWGPLAQIK
jgi:hypothetical protein